MYLQNRSKLTDTENRLWLPKERGREGLGVWGQQMPTIKYRMDKKQGATV